MFVMLSNAYLVCLEWILMFPVTPVVLLFLSPLFSEESIVLSRLSRNGLLLYSFRYFRSAFVLSVLSHVVLLNFMCVLPKTLIYFLTDNRLFISKFINIQIWAFTLSEGELFKKVRIGRFGTIVSKWLYVIY